VGVIERRRNCYAPPQKKANPLARNTARPARKIQTMTVRFATIADLPALQELIELSARHLSVGFYTPAQIDAAVKYVFGVDTQLIADGTYYVIPGAAGPVAAGGWSARRTLYGGDQMKSADDPKLDPARDAARIRAFFVHPDWARRGLARQIYYECEQAAYAAGFRRFELMATLPGEPLYRALGFTPVEYLTSAVADGIHIPFVRMTRPIDRSATSGLNGNLC
jgi:GNAT superfamily N-acetyltransferase